MKLSMEGEDITSYLGDGNYVKIKTPPVKISDKEKLTLINLLNNGARLGFDFDLNTNGNQISINPIVRDLDGNYVQNIPEYLRNEAFELLKQGFRAVNDYNIIQNDDGSYKIDYQSTKAMNYEGDEKYITYSKDGNAKQIVTTNGEVVKIETTDSNGNKFVQTASRTDEFLMKLMEGDFLGANNLLGDLISGVHDFNIYEVGIKYEEKSGKNLMAEFIKQYSAGNVNIESLYRLVLFGYEPTELPSVEQLQQWYDISIEDTKIINKFDPKKSQVTGLLSEFSKKNVFSDTKYSQTINNQTFLVELKNNALEITRDGLTKSIDLSGIHPNIQKNLLNCSPIVLFRFASLGSKLILKDRDSDRAVLGRFLEETKDIELFTEALIGKLLNAVLAHEVGHSYYNDLTETNSKLEEAFAEERQAWRISEEEVKTGNSVYCTVNVLEFVAEAYTLLATGECNSSYTICKYFPKTFAIVKELIENEDK